jgi:hypothetical protein
MSLLYQKKHSKLLSATIRRPLYESLNATFLSARGYMNVGVARKANRATRLQMI